MITIIAKCWGNVKHEKVETYKCIALCVRDFSVHWDRDFHCEGWSLGLGWLQISYGTFSKPLTSQVNHD